MVLYEYSRGGKTMEKIVDAEIKVEEKIIGRMSCADGQDRQFCENLCRKLHAALSSATKEMFLLTLSESDNSREQPTYSITVNGNGGDKDTSEIFDALTGSRRKRPAVESVAKQSYIGLKLKDPAANYCGFVEIRLVMSGRKECDPYDSVSVIEPAAENLIGIAFYHYYRTIKQLYPGWQTQYLDAPSVASWIFSKK